jgi:hypothetical protein
MITDREISGERGSRRLQISNLVPHGTQLGFTLQLYPTLSQNLSHGRLEDIKAVLTAADVGDSLGSTQWVPSDELTVVHSIGRSSHHFRNEGLFLTTKHVLMVTHASHPKRSFKSFFIER